MRSRWLVILIAAVAVVPVAISQPPAAPVAPTRAQRHADGAASATRRAPGDRHRLPLPRAVLLVDALHLPRRRRRRPAAAIRQRRRTTCRRTTTARKSSTLVEERARPTSADDHMGPMGKFVTAKDHFEPCCSSTGNQTYPWQLDDATVTIPGESCPGQVVLIAGHNDSTPTPTTVANGAASGSATPMSGMRSGNWGNGSPYDADSGIVDGDGGVAGPAALVPARTAPTRSARSRSGCSTPRRPGLVGSGDYSQTDTPTTLPGAVGAGATTHLPSPR